MPIDSHLATIRIVLSAMMLVAVASCSEGSGNGDPGGSTPDATTGNTSHDARAPAASSGGGSGAGGAPRPDGSAVAQTDGGRIVPPTGTAYPVVQEPSAFVFKVAKPACTTPRTAVAVGSGSFADCPPDDAGLPANVKEMYTTRKIWSVDPDQPMPTNDWWTSLLINQYGGNLWAYPLVVRPQSYGFDVSSVDSWITKDPNGFTAATAGKIQVTATGFTAAASPARKWSDWLVDFQLDGANGQQMVVTVGHGFPFTWVETKGITPHLKIPGLTSFDDDGKPLSFPYTGDHVGVTTGGKSYGIFAPPRSTFTQTADGLDVSWGGNAGYLSIGVLTAPMDLKDYTPYAYAIPRETTVSYSYVPQDGQVRTLWEVRAENLRGEPNVDVIQGFIPHHYAKTDRAFQFNGREYFTPRGTLKCAVGKSFEIVYRFNGMLPVLPVPEAPTGAAHPYQGSRMTQLLNDYATVTSYGADTYWGGKDVEKLAQYALMAKLSGNASAASALVKSLKTAMVDWLTYTPGEKEHFFAYYWNWKALIGMKPSYWSEQFTDNHFHYGYFAVSAALLSLLDADFRDKYGPMAALVVKQYANYNRDDKSFPLFRTFDPWGGHSYAGGFSDPNSGNNQESSSESMQSWGGVFLLGAALGDDAMRNAGAFGWAVESQACSEYVFNREHTNFPPAWTHMISTPIRDDHIGYWKYFEGDVMWEHAIQWLPMNTSLYYLGEDYDYAAKEFAGAMAENPGKSIGDWGSGLGNVVLSFQQIADPDGAAKTFDDLWDANSKVVHDKDTSGKTYWFTHSNRRLGRIAWDWHTNLPTSQVFVNAATHEFSAVAYNPTQVEQTCTIYKESIVIDSFKVGPAELGVYRKPLP
jgi:endoglucanase Acf2